MNRRTFLRATGVCLALPALESFAQTASPQRMVAVNIPLGFYPPNFFPTGTGRDYQSSAYLKLADPLREKFTIISGTSHPGVDGGHSAEKSFLTAAPHPDARGFKNSISLDQFIAKRIGDSTRFASLTVGEKSLSFTENGVAIPNEESPSRMFAKLFLKGTDQDIATQKQQLRDGHSILDNVLDEAKSTQSKVSRRDREKIDQFFTAIRETERRLDKSARWLDTPKPDVDAEQPKDVGSIDVVAWTRAHFDVIRLALQTDSTRIVAFAGAGHGQVVPLQGVSQGYHNLTHHGKNPEMIKQLEIIERATIEVWAEFLSKLEATKDGNGTLLDHTQVLMGSNLGSASGHITTNLPIILAGGGYKHGQHLAFDQKNNAPLANLFVSMMQKLGLETNNFATSKSTMTGLI
jgi:hypothetical protein